MARFLKLKDKRALTFETLCKHCTHNGANHQEYGRLCPDPAECLKTHKSKEAKHCPLWNRLRVAFGLEQVEEVIGDEAAGRLRYKEDTDVP